VGSNQKPTEKYRNPKTRQIRSFFIKKQFNLKVREEPKKPTRLGFLRKPFFTTLVYITIAILADCVVQEGSSSAMASGSGSAGSSSANVNAANRSSSSSVNPFVSSPHGHPSFQPVKLGTKGTVSNGWLLSVVLYSFFLEI